ncbi:type IV pilus modification PilV family protein [Cytobacillus massiliigabonensis]|uniref:type IV pilus modification PilV family protein n=1 Tax=Cytobacillus massiliigabonensis TaxID=1871011 RepID=UPI000C81F7E3|nr:type II secretion system protein [Cytobacillus massiliigabonensis]
MKNEKGITLVELLAAVVIAGIVIVPLLTIMTGTFTRTISQEKESEMAYIAQEVMEKIRLKNTPSLLSDGCWTNVDYIDNSCKGPLNEINVNTNLHVYISTEVKTSPENPNFDEVKLIVKTPIKVVNGSGGKIEDRSREIELVTVVKK